MAAETAASWPKDETINHRDITATYQELGSFIPTEATFQEINSPPYNLKHPLEICMLYCILKNVLIFFKFLPLRALAPLHDAEQ